uniref:Ets homologous factor n=1 Tax=Callorhinchus milii TaxID=7868 RepID=A0A4W3H5Z4_CALMI
MCVCVCLYVCAVYVCVWCCMCVWCCVCVCAMLCVCRSSSSPTRPFTWYQVPPERWDRQQVWSWLQQTMDRHQLDAEWVSFPHLDMAGDRLVTMTLDQFCRAAGPLGPTLYTIVQNLRWGRPSAGPPPTPPSPGTGHAGTSPPAPPPTPGSAGINQFTTGLLTASSLPPRLLNAPPVPARSTHLWEFLRDILLHPGEHPGLIKWEDRADGVFRFLKSGAVAELWGRKKNNSSMTYEKLSRAMRYYYKRQILERVDGRRLVYKFGRKALGWRVEG